MASRKDLVTLLCERQEKQPFVTASDDLVNQILYDVNRAYRYCYNNSDLSYKTVMLSPYTYAAGAFAAGSNPVPDNFLSFQATGAVYDITTDPPHKLTYIPWHRMIEFMVGRLKNRTGTPRFYSVGGPMDQSTSLRDFVIAPIPMAVNVDLTLVYQGIPQADGVIYDPPNNPVDADDWSVEITPIPVSWHTTLLLDMAILFRKMDKGLSVAEQNALLAEAFKQMQTQEPHGREAPRTLPRFPAWGGGYRRTA